MAFDGSKSGEFKPYQPPGKWKTLGMLVVLMIVLVGMLVFLLSL